MDLERRLDILAGGATTEVVGMSAGRPLRRGFKTGWVYHAAAPGGRRIRMMSLLMTNACSFSCRYCPTRRDRDVPRAAVTPDELARTFHELVQSDLADGLFLTSGIPGRPQAMMDRMLAAVEQIRRRYQFQGYIHLKILPGADDEQIARACRLASRVSINLEAPQEHSLHEIAPEKSLDRQILPALERIARLRGGCDGCSRNLLPAGVTSQLIAGVTDNSDRELLSLSTELVRNKQLTKPHFSTFEPVAETPLENRPAESFTREHRLYQADFLIRQYQFNLAELPFDERGQLSRSVDPKLAWALAHPEFYPVEVLHADREALLRVPGFGPVSVRRLLDARRNAVLRRLEDLQAFGVAVKRARNFITLNGKRFEAAASYERPLLPFDAPLSERFALTCRNGISPCAFR